MALPHDLRLVVVTPETTLLDEPAEALRFPLYDGQFGVLPGRAPVIGRLGFGELKVTTASGERRFYIDGGFVQIKGQTVTLLTERAIPADEIDASEAEARLQAAKSRRATTDLELAQREREQERARQMLAVVRK